MGYPNGVSLAVVSGGTAFTAFGDDVPVQITVTPRFPKQGGGFLTRIIHAATGWVMTSDPDTFTAEAGTEVSFSVPHVDQAGFRDPAQNAYTGWYYEVKVVVGAARGRTKTAYTQTVSPVVGQALVDLDLVPEGQNGSPQSVAVPEVLSVNGQTGAVVVEAGADDGEIAVLIQDPATSTGAALDTRNAELIQDPASSTGAALDSRFATPTDIDTKMDQRLFIGQTEPSNPFAGMIWFDTAPSGADTLDRLSSLVARWRMDDLSTPSGESVSAVDPVGGSSYTQLLQPTAANQPSMVGTFAGSHKALSFVGANSDHMTFALPTFNAPMTVFSVVDIKAALTYVYSGQSDSTHAGLLTNTGGTTVRINGTSNLAGGITKTWAPGSGAAVVAGVYVPGTGAGRFYYNSLTPLTGTVTTNPMSGLGNFYLGRAAAGYGGASAAFDIAELAFVSGELSDADVKAVMQDLADYYGMTLEV